MLAKAVFAVLAAVAVYWVVGRGLFYRSLLDLEKPAVAAGDRPLLFRSTGTSRWREYLATDAGTIDESVCEHVTKYTDRDAIFAARGFEDIVPISATEAISCAGNLGRLWDHKHGPEGTPQGACVLLTYDAKGNGSVRFDDLALINFPRGVAFHPHGIDVAGGQLFAINHAYGRGGERVEVFSLRLESRNLLHERSITSESMTERHNGILNDLTVVSPGVFFATSYLSQPDPPAGRTLLSEAVNTALVITEFGDTSVLRCTYDASDNGTTVDVTCTQVASGFKMANGIAAVAVPKVGGVLVVNDPVNRTMVVMALCGVELDVCPGPVKRIAMQHAADNIQREAFSAQESAASFIAGSIYSRRAAPRGPGPAVSPGGATRIRLDFDTSDEAQLSGEIVKEATQVDLAFHAGDAFPGTASAWAFRGKKLVVMGSFREAGFMLCRLPPAAAPNASTTTSPK